MYMADLRKKNFHVNQMSEAEYSEQLETPTVGIIFADVARIRFALPVI